MTLISLGSQAAAHQSIRDWLRQPYGDQVFRLTGPAGSGKTRLATDIGREFSAQYVTPTNKSAAVLRNRGADTATTIHSYLYGAPKKDRNGKLVWRLREHGRPYVPFLIVDEGGMVGASEGADLCHCAARLLVTKDDHQLPPISGRAYFAGSDFHLDEIYRQAAGSQPLQLATILREGGDITPAPFDLSALRDADVIICATHRMRAYANYLARRSRGIRGPYPTVGEPLVNLRNDYDRELWNGTLWTITGLRERGELLELDLIDDNGATAEALVPERCVIDDWRDLGEIPAQLNVMAYGYCLTAHKAQGSEWEHVVVIDETGSPGFAMMAASSPLGPEQFRRRWLYTAVTRAISHVDVMQVPR